VKKLGKVLREATTKPGLLIIEGQQFPFSADDAWRSEQPPSPGMSVEVELGSRGEILAIRPITQVRNAKVEGRASRILGKLLASKR
jgi:hypothetical protein